MYYAYILKSQKDQSNYFGSTQDLRTRIKNHNSGKVKYTKGHRPYKLHYFERFNKRKEAIARETYFKSIDGYNWLKLKGII